MTKKNATTQSATTGRLIGYARVSTVDQNLQSQIRSLKQHGIDRKWIFTDKASGAKAERPGLEKCLATLQPGDVLVVYRLDHLGRSLRNLVDLMERLQKEHVGLRSLSDGIIDTTSAGGRLIFGIFSVLAEFERELIRERTVAGLEAARARERIGGRKGYSPDDLRVIVAKKLYEDRELSIREICEKLGITRPTLYRRLRGGMSAIARPSQGTS